MTELSSHEQFAREYLAEQLGADAPSTLTSIGHYAESPLNGEGEVTVFAFELSRCGNRPEQCHVVVGQTVPNYYPAWGLSADETYSVHVGSRFMLVVGVTQGPLSAVSPELEQSIRTALAGAAPGADLAQFQVIAAFTFDNQTHVVGRGMVDSQPVYLVAGDVPLGVYTRTDLPPHVIYRIHLGNVIRRERPGGDG